MTETPTPYADVARPPALQPLYAPVQSLDGIGPKLAALLSRLVPASPMAGGARLLDLLWHFPTGVVDRRAQPTIISAVPGTIATLCVTVGRHAKPGRGSRAPYRISCSDGTGTLDLVYFRADPRHLAELAPEGSTRLVSGKLEAYGDTLQMPHPDHVVAPETADKLPLVEPIYPLTAGVSQRVVAKAIKAALGRISPLPEWHEPTLAAQRQWLDWGSSLRAVHLPSDPAEISNQSPAWQRLAYDELLAHQVTLHVVRSLARSSPGRELHGTGETQARLANALPFALTGGQRGAIAEIHGDMAAPATMLRLLQGDVGSGKTVVALMAMAPAFDRGAQAALMAPTEVLARQHAETIEPLAAKAGLTVGLLTGREKGKPRKALLEQVRSGSIDLLIGTHALFQPDVQFHDLGLAVIDEQHRFGVQQRLALQRKGATSIQAVKALQAASEPLTAPTDGAPEPPENPAYAANVLVMTATPIPRTLLMTNYGDLDVSRLTEKPAGRKPVVTRIVANERLDEVVQGLRRAINEGAQAYWVCPLVEGTGKSDLAAAEERHGQLQQIFGPRIGLVHGQMSGPDKDAVMAGFASGEVRILVATTVIEVGVNVPNASIMVIEHAERFGLAQLHQLRGRVGRGSRASSCILMYAAPLSLNGRARLETMRETEDGFVIAEEDLRLRGGGEMLGTRQSGMPEFRVARVPNATELLEMAHDDAALLLDRDPTLQSERGKAIRVLLHLWECDAAISLFRAG